MRSSPRRLLFLLAALPVTVFILAALYMVGMEVLEGRPRDYVASLEWASETLTSTGYGRDNQWQHPVMIAFVVFVQFLGLSLAFLIFPLYVMPFFEDRFEGRLPRTVGDIKDYVLVYRFGPAVAALLPELDRAGVASVVLEEDETEARRLRDRGRNVVYAQFEQEDFDANLFSRTRAVIANGSDHANGALVLSARQQGFDGEIIALVEDPFHRKPMALAGATSVYTPLHVLAAALASTASDKINPRIAGLRPLGQFIETAELRIGSDSDLAGKTLAEADIRGRTGATIVGKWVGGKFIASPGGQTVLESGGILMAVGSQAAIERVGKLAAPLPREGPFLILGHGEVGRKLVQLLTDAGERALVVDQVEGEGVDFVGDALDQELLRKAGAEGAKAIILALGSDSATLFAAAVVRDLVAEVPIVARVNRAENVERIHAAGADFAMSLGQVAGQILAHQLLGEEWISLESRVKLVKLEAGRLAGKTVRTAEVGRKTHCAIVAVQRGDEVKVEVDDDYEFTESDTVYVTGPEDSLEVYRKTFVP